MKSRHSSSGSGSSNEKQNKDGNGNLKTQLGVQIPDVSSPVRLNIKIYSDPSYDEGSYVGFVRIPLDSETFMPIEKTVGSNWYVYRNYYYFKTFSLRRSDYFITIRNVGIRNNNSVLKVLFPFRLFIFFCFFCKFKNI